MATKRKPAAKVLKSKMRRISAGEDRLLQVLALYFPEKQAREQATAVLVRVVDDVLRPDGEVPRNAAHEEELWCLFQEQRERMTGE